MESAPSSAWTNGAAETSPRPTTDPPGYINTNKHRAFGVAGSCWIPILLPGDAAERSLSKQSSPGLSIFSRNMFVTKTNCSINRNGNRKAEQAGRQEEEEAALRSMPSTSCPPGKSDTTDHVES